MVKRLVGGMAVLLALCASLTGRPAAAQDGDPASGDMAMNPPRVVLAFTLAGHPAGVHDVAISPDAAWLASAGADGTVRVWSMVTPDVQPVVLAAHTGAVVDVAYSTDGTRLAAAGTDGAALLWDTADLDAAPQRLALDAAAQHVAFAGADQLVTLGADGTLTLWDVASGLAAQPVQQRDTGHYTARGLAVSPSAVLLVTGSTDGAIRLWDAQTLDTAHSINFDSDAVHAIALSPDGRLLAASDTTGVIRVWAVDNATTPGALHTLNGHSAAVAGLAFSADGHMLASAGTDGTLRLWDAGETGSGAELVQLDHHAAATNNVTFSTDGRYLAASAADGVIHVWRVLMPPTPDEITALLAENIAALVAEDLARYLATLHPGAPDYAVAEPLMRNLFAAYDLDITLVSATWVGQEGASFYVRAVQQTRERNGAFAENEQIVLHTLRQYEGEWRIYASAPVDVAYYE